MSGCEAVTNGVRCQRPAAFQLSGPAGTVDRTVLSCGTHLRQLMVGAVDAWVVVSVVKAVRS